MKLELNLNLHSSNSIHIRTWSFCMMEVTAEVARVSCLDEQSCFSLWNLKSGLQMKNFKGAQCGKHCITSVGNDYVFTAQDNKQVVHVWDFKKERLHMKTVCPGKITAMCCSPDGNYCVFALMEKIYVWQVPTGNLMQILSKHFQPVLCLKFTDDGSHFVSGGEDNLVVVWNMSRVLSVSNEGSSWKKNQEPRHTWSHHSLPVRDIHVGAGGMRCRVATCSLDQTCKLYDLASGQLLLSLLFDNGLSSVTMDAAEQFLFVGGVTGKINLVNLHEKTRQDGNKIDGNKNMEAFEGHSKEVTSLSVSTSGMTLLSGSDDCTARVWHIGSKQCIKKMNFKGKVTNATIMRSPPDFSSKSSSTIQMPICNFKRKIYQPFHSETSDENTPDQDKGIPIILKNIDEGCLNTCDNIFKDSNICDVSEVLSERQRHVLEVDNEATEDRSQMSRTMLLNRIEQLENLSRTLYQFSVKQVSDPV